MFLEKYFSPSDKKPKKPAEDKPKAGGGESSSFVSHDVTLKEFYVCLA